MKRFFLMLTMTVMLMAIVAFAGPAFAQGGHVNCKAFGQNTAEFATTLGGTFGQTAAAGAPLNDTVKIEQAALYEPR